ncbi:MAG: hypothetical protein Q7J47_21170 [Azoarcus sp.]|nr:hypothetical protein [Azoarcus sp.]
MRRIAGSARGAKVMRQAQSVFSQARHLVRTTAAAVLFACAGPGLAAPDWDIVGIRLGMTEQEARAALAAHSAQAQISGRTLKFMFNDGAKQQETPDFLATIQAQIPGPPNTSDTESIKLELSAPPLEQRVIGVRRVVTSYQNPPPLERVVEALTQKYGKPVDYRTLGMGVKSTFAGWTEAGKTACGLQPGKGISLPGASQSPNDLKKFYQWQQQKLAPADLSKCSALLLAKMDYREGGSSVNTLVVEMNDYGYLLQALEATAKWLSETEAEARKARLNSGAAPKL